MSYLFQNPELPTEQRIDDLISLMTLEEKVHCLGTDPSIPRLGVQGSRHVEGLHGLARGGPSNWGKVHVIPTTTFCQAYGLGETWDPDLIQEVARIEATECRYIFQTSGFQHAGIVVRAPNADLGRDPRWGRTEECYGEDPFLTATLTVAFVKGLQGDHPRYWLTASLMKHFLANSNEDGRDNSDSVVDERLWREYYSYPFWRGVVDGGSRAYMAAYNAVNGIACAIHPMLKDITVDEWGQDGIICTDGGAMKLLVTAHKAEPDEAHAVAQIVKAGIGQFLDDYEAGANEALEKGLLTEADIDAVLRGNFRVMIKLGMLDSDVPYAAIGGIEKPWDRQDRRDFVREATRKSIVLLKNEGLLPLDRKALRKVALIGPRSDEVILDWYSGTPPYVVTPLKGVQAALGPDVEVVHTDGEDRQEAARLAREADVAIVCVGNNPISGDEKGWAQIDMPSEGREAVDRQIIDLEGEDLIQRVFAANPKTVVVLIASFPYAINWTQEHVPAILHMTHGSQEHGNALADVLFGDFNPGGKLTQTWPRSLDQLPPMMDYDICNGRTYMYFEGSPLYPFGFGLSYTTFALSNLHVQVDEAGTFAVRVDVSNTGTRDGEEVVQLYVRYLDSRVERPKLHLRGFKRVFVGAGATVSVDMRIDSHLLCYWDVASHAWIDEGCTLELSAGASSGNRPLSIQVSRQNA